MNKLSKKFIYGAVTSTSLVPILAQAHSGDMMYHNNMYYSGANYMPAQLGLVSGFLFILFWIIVTLLLAFWLAMLIDIIQYDWENDSDRVAYLVLVIFLNILGAAIYYFFVKRHLKKHKQNN